MNYLAFLVVLKNLLPGKTVSIAVLASYWYLKQFPIDKISKVVHYIVFMTTIYTVSGTTTASTHERAVRTAIACAATSI